MQVTTVFLHVSANSSFITKSTIRRCFNFSAGKIVEQEYAVKQVDEALRYNPKVRGLFSRWGH